MCKYDVNNIKIKNVCVVHIISKLNALKELKFVMSLSRIQLGSLAPVSLLRL